MPTTKFIVPNFAGLFTNNNLLFNNANDYYTNSTSAYSDGTGMLVANNIVLSRPNIVEPRHAFAYVKLNSGTQPAYKSTAANNPQFVGLYEWNQYGLTSYILPTSLSNTGKIGQLTGNYSSGEIETFTFIQNNTTGTAPSFTKVATTDWNTPDFFESRDQIFVSSPIGIWRQQGDPTTPSLTVNEFSRADPPWPSQFTAVTSGSTGWLLKGNETYVCAVVTRKVSSTQYIYSRVSPYINVRNFDQIAGYNVACTLYPGYFAVAGDVVEFYRSAQLPIGSGLTSFANMRLAGKQTFADTTTQMSFTLLGDDASLALAGSSSLGGAPGTILEVDNVTLPGCFPPISKTVTTFQGYTFYGNTKTAALGSLEFLKLPSNGTTLTFATSAAGANAYTVTFSTSASGTSQILVPSNAAAFANTAAGLSFTGAVSGQNFGVDTAIFTPHLQGNWVAGGSIPATPDLPVTIAGSGIDLNKIPLTNGIILVQGTGSDKAVCMFSYVSIDTTTAGIIKFKSVSTASNLSFTFGAATNYNFFCLNIGAVAGAAEGTSMFNIPLYFGAANYLCPLVDAGGIIYPVASAIQNGAYSLSGGFLQTGIVAQGLNAQPQSGLIKLLIQNMVYTFNANQLATSNFYVDVSQADVRQFTVEALNPNIEQIYVKCSDTALLSPTLSSSVYTLINDNVRTQNGIINSRVNLPNLVSRFSYLSPQQIGSPSKRLLKLATTSNDMFAFKENDGIYRIVLQPGSNPDFPVYQNVLSLDNTVFLYSAESVQEFQQTIYFLSQKGIYRLDSSSLGKLSERIENLLLQLIAQCPADNIQSFKDEFRSFYGLHFPAVNADGSGVTLVYDFIRDNFYSWNDVEYQAFITTQRNRCMYITKDLSLALANTITFSSAGGSNNAAAATATLNTGSLVQVTGGGLPTGLSASTYYWAVVIDATTVQFASTLANALAGTTIALGAGSGTISAYADNTNSLNAVNYGNSYTWQYLRMERFTGENESDTIDNTYDLIVTNAGDQVATFTVATNQPNAEIDQVEYTTVSSVVVSQTNASPIQVKYAYSGVSQTTVYDDLGDVVNFLKGKQLYAVCKTNTNTNVAPVEVSLKYVEPLVSGSCALTVEFPSTVTYVVTNPPTDALLIGVNTEFDFRPFHANNPQMNKRFSEVAFTTQDYTSTYIKTSFAVDNQAGYSVETVFSNIIPTQQIYRAFIPIDSSRGRFLKVRFRHGTPKERFAVNSMSIVYTQTQSTTTTKAH